MMLRTISRLVKNNYNQFSTSTKTLDHHSNDLPEYVNRKNAAKLFQLKDNYIVSATNEAEFEVNQLLIILKSHELPKSVLSDLLKWKQFN
jgi:hypothetical protein